ncbi:MAG: hypothetical protein KBB56_13720 [Acidobacteria bacterium]|nr:hypothetical protein [Acidobacteriota bacterium]
MNTDVLIRLILVGGLAAALGVAAGAQNSVYYFPHVVDGGFIFGSEFWFNNVQATPTTITLSFYDEAGNPWTVDLRSFDGGTGYNSTFTFTLQPYSSRFYFTGCVDPLKVGWAKAVASQPINTSASFSFYDFGPDPAEVIWSAGVLPSPVATQFAFAANVSPVEDITSDTKVDMGFAIVNPSLTDVEDADATITATLIPTAGGAPVSTKTITVKVGGHYSRFLSELFNDVAWGTRFHGIVRLSSNVNISVLALKHIWNDRSDVYSTVAVQPESTFRYNTFYDLEYNNSLAEAQPIDPPVEIIGTLNSAVDGPDLDFFAVHLNTGETLYVTFMANALGAPLETGMLLYDPTDFVVLMTDTTGLLDPRFTYTATTSGTHRIQCASADATFSRESFYRMFVEVR